MGLLPKLLAATIAAAISVGFESGIAGNKGSFIPSDPRLGFKHVAKRTDVRFFESFVRYAAPYIVVKYAVNDCFAGRHWVAAITAVEASDDAQRIQSGHYCLSPGFGMEPFASVVSLDAQTSPILGRRGFYGSVLHRVIRADARLFSEVYKDRVELDDFAFLRGGAEPSAYNGNPGSFGQLQGMLSFDNAPDADDDKKNCCQRSPKIGGPKIFSYATALFGGVVLIFSGLWHRAAPPLAAWPISIASFLAACLLLYIGIGGVIH
jgi:hypothetical protein